MTAGSLIGAALGALTVSLAPTGGLKLVLGTVLLLAAAKSLRHPT
jgi:uncharacterized membrane protein YfcA